MQWYTCTHINIVTGRHILMYACALKRNGCLPSCTGGWADVRRALVFEAGANAARCCSRTVRSRRFASRGGVGSLRPGPGPARAC